MISSMAVKLCCEPRGGCIAGTATRLPCRGHGAGVASYSSSELFLLRPAVRVGLAIWLMLSVRSMTSMSPGDSGMTRAGFAEVCLESCGFGIDWYVATPRIECSGLAWYEGVVSGSAGPIDTRFRLLAEPGAVRSLAMSSPRSRAVSPMISVLCSSAPCGSARVSSSAG